jgi:hypothetical protein
VSRCTCFTLFASTHITSRICVSLLARSATAVGSATFAGNRNDQEACVWYASSSGLGKMSGWAADAAACRAFLGAPCCAAPAAPAPAPSCCSSSLWRGARQLACQHSSVAQRAPVHARQDDEAVELVRLAQRLSGLLLRLPPPVAADVGNLVEQASRQRRRNLRQAVSGAGVCNGRRH